MEENSTNDTYWKGEKSIQKLLHTFQKNMCIFIP